MDAKNVAQAMIRQTNTSLKAIEDDKLQIQQQIAELQQRFYTLTEQHFTLTGKLQAYNEMLTVLEKTETAPPVVETATSE